jgi:prepilin-type N-terminal cleavage/methylation domain-containing protein
MSIKYLSRVSGNRSEAGFTLLELLFSISITGLLLAILAQFLLSGVQLWERNDRGYRRQHQLKLVYQTAYNELSTMCYGEYLPDFIINGDDWQLGFWRETTRGLVFVKYRYDLNEKIVYYSEGFYGSKPPETALYKEIINWQFEYFDQKNRNWLREWKSDRKELPALIRITVKSKDADLGTLTIPVKAWHVVQQNEFGT